MYSVKQINENDTFLGVEMFRENTQPGTDYTHTELSYLSGSFFNTRSTHNLTSSL